MNEQISKNRLVGYLALGAGFGCAASTAEAELQFVDLSGLGGGLARGANILLPGDGLPDLTVGSIGQLGYLSSRVGSYFFGGGTFGGSRGYEGDVFPLAGGPFALWYGDSDPSVVIDGFTAGASNVVPFKDTEDRFGWLSFDLGATTSATFFSPSKYNWFVYDDAATDAASAPTRSASEAFAAASIPEPSSVALLALGAAGVLARRRRKKAA